MIKTKKGETVIEGNCSEICADLAVIIDSVNQVFAEEFGAEQAKKYIMQAVEYGFMHDDELETKKKECVDKVACELTEALDELKELIMKGMMKNGGK